MRASTCTAFKFATFSPPTSSQPASSPGGVSTLAPSAIMAFQAFGYVSGTFQPNMCAASGTSVSAVRSLLRSPARCSTAAMHSSRGPAACRSSGCIALHALRSSFHPLSSCFSPKDRFELHSHPPSLYVPISLLAAATGVSCFYFSRLPMCAMPVPIY